MAEMRALSPLVEPLSLDEAFIDLAASGLTGLTVDDVQAIADDLKAAIRKVTGGLTASVGAGTSKLIAKIASDLDKPDGVVVVPAGTEAEFLAPMQVTVIPVSVRRRAAAEHGRRRTVADLQQLDEDELIRQVGSAHGTSLHRLAIAADDRPVVSDRETKSVSVEDTFETDIIDRALLAAIGDRMAHRVSERLQKAQLSGRTVTVKTRMHDFTTHTRSSTLAGPTDDARVIARVARRLLDDSDIGGGIRLLGVGVSSLADWIQDDLFTESEYAERAARGGRAAGAPARPDRLPSRPGRRASGPRPRLGVGLRTRPRHRPLRDRGHAAGARCGPSRSTIRADKSAQPVERKKTTNPKLTRMGRMNEERRGVYPFCAPCTASSIAWRAADTAGRRDRQPLLRPPRRLRELRLLGPHAVQHVPVDPGVEGRPVPDHPDRRPQLHRPQGGRPSRSDRRTAGAGVGDRASTRSSTAIRRTSRPRRTGTRASPVRRCRSTNRR